MSDNIVSTWHTYADLITLEDRHARTEWRGKGTINDGIRATIKCDSDAIISRASHTSDGVVFNCITNAHLPGGLGYK